MAYPASALEVFIASPSDVPAERAAVREVIAEWNAIHSRERGIALMPVGWETHSSPELSGRPQEMVNQRLLAYADVLVGIFSTRIGTATGKAASGTIEEIEPSWFPHFPNKRHNSAAMRAFLSSFADRTDRTHYMQASCRADSPTMQA